MAAYRDQFSRNLSVSLLRPITRHRNRNRNRNIFGRSLAPTSQNMILSTSNVDQMRWIEWTLAWIEWSPKRLGNWRSRVQIRFPKSTKSTQPFVTRRGEWQSVDHKNTMQINLHKLQLFLEQVCSCSQNRSVVVQAPTTRDLHVIFFLNPEQTRSRTGFNLRRFLTFYNDKNVFMVKYLIDPFKCLEMSHWPNKCLGCWVTHRSAEG